MYMQELNSNLLRQEIYISQGITPSLESLCHLEVQGPSHYKTRAFPARDVTGILVICAIAGGSYLQHGNF